MVDHVLLLMMIMKEIHGLTIDTYIHLCTPVLNYGATSFDGGGGEFLVEKFEALEQGRFLVQKCEGLTHRASARFTPHGGTRARYWCVQSVSRALDIPVVPRDLAPLRICMNDRYAGLGQGRGRGLRMILIPMGVMGAL